MRCCRSRFLSECFFFSVRRASSADRGRRVGFRFFGTARARATVSANRRSAVCRLRSWLRVSLATTRIDPSSLRREARREVSRSRCSSERTRDRTMFHFISTRDEVLLTCCPPAPDARDALISSSDRGMKTEPAISMLSSVECALGRSPFIRMMIAGGARSSRQQ